MDFVILKVNGQDLSGATHQEAVEAFRRAQEPIIVQVVRQSAAAQSQPEPPPPPSLPPHCSIPPPPLKPLPQVPHSDGLAIGSWCQGNSNNHSSSNTSGRHSSASHSSGSSDRCPVTSLQRLHHVAPPQSTPPPVPPFPSQLLRCGLFSASSPGESLSSVAEDEFYNNVDDFDYEEVILCRNSACDKLGLTLCYSSFDCDSSDSLTDVLVCEVEPGSIAALCGRVHPGDQIMRINGQPVRSRDQAVRLFGSAERRVALLLARPSAAAASDTGGSDRSSSSSAVATAPLTTLDELHLDLMMLEAPAEVDETEELIEDAYDDEVAVREAERDRHQDSGVSSTQSSEQEVEELAAALTRLTPNSISPDVRTKQQQQQQQQQQRCVPRMGTRLQRSPQPSAPAAPAPPPASRTFRVTATAASSASRSAACQTGAQEVVEQNQLAALSLPNRQQVQESLPRCPASQQQQQQPRVQEQRHRHQPVQEERQPQPQPQPQPQRQPQMEWVVKRRADGSRYVTRRPVRSRLLKARAAQLAEERAGLTTDDDAASCLGRWAPRHERKQHLLRARKQQLQLHQQHQQQQQHLHQQQQHQQHQLDPASVIFV